ncbi:hydroxymethylglutaryl-CoA lyase [Rossellomorea vietnamensis]|uniref:Hydroxymethylglutaryl-CoA lyase n=1 Tax=Rossellomorea vietnamensis TaxID=218284 RepID=A0A5D4LZC4_9BACI|nr:hydroxymethylglutaryl-CoA lyase [Rossellomorea vietnamensis]TYR94856.1 hydroxymethylglutaryl-CoA lyase [Rossellomorea vietnamensis]
MQRILIQEVGPRDGLQMEPEFFPTGKKIELINQLSEAGVDKIEVSSFVSPKAIPNLKDAEDVFQKINRKEGVTYTALVPNLKGAERAISAGADELNLVASVSETHNQKNIRRTVEESFQGFKEIIRLADANHIPVNGTLATTFGCPFEGSIDPQRVIELVVRYLDMGASGITLADTTGMAVPYQVYKLCSEVLDRYPEVPITLHFHNTRGMGLANVVESIRAGVVRYDASVGGLGGCPFAPGATGNICTEDLVHMLKFSGHEVRADLPALIEASKFLQKEIGHEVPGQVIKSGLITDLHSA